MSYPGSVKTQTGFALLILVHFGQSNFVDLDVLTTGNERSHTAHSVSPAFMTGLYEKLTVSLHEGNCHGHLGPIGQYELTAIAEFFDDAENIVPAPGVESSSVIF